MAKFYTCPYCNSHLDHGERCDCQGLSENKRKNKEPEKEMFSYVKMAGNRQLSTPLKKVKSLA